LIILKLVNFLLESKLNFFKNLFKKVDINFVDRKLIINGNEVSVDYPVKEAFNFKDKILVFFDPDTYKSKFGQFHNLICVDFYGNKIWEVELPTHESSDRYYKISRKSPLILYSITSFECEIDPNTGKIIKKVFYK